MGMRQNRMLLVMASTLPCAVAVAAASKQANQRPEVKHPKPHKVKTRGKGF